MASEVPDTSDPSDAVRPARPEDEKPAVDLALRAWAPVFASLSDALGPDLYHRMYPDWRSQQADVVRQSLSTHQAWVSERDNRVTGFVSVVFDEQESSGEIHLIAVDPSFQRQGIARRLIDVALAEMRQRGLTLATVSTGGDRGHLPARLTYQAAGFRPFPQVYYAQVLDPGPDSRPDPGP